MGAKRTGERVLGVRRWSFLVVSEPPVPFWGVQALGGISVFLCRPERDGRCDYLLDGAGLGYHDRSVKVPVVEEDERAVMFPDAVSLHLQELGDIWSVLLKGTAEVVEAPVDFLAALGPVEVHLVPFPALGKAACEEDEFPPQHQAHHLQVERR